MVLVGVANTVMEDHFDTGRHYAHVLLKLDSGQRVLLGLGHGARYTGDRVSVVPCLCGTLTTPLTSHEAGVW